MNNTHTLVMSRTFNASTERLWQAWSDATLVKQWWGPNGFTCPSVVMDFREGGTSLVCMHAPYGQDYYSTWAYQKIVPLERIEYIHNLADKDGRKIDPAAVGMPADFPQDALHSVIFKTLADGRTEVTITEPGFASEQLFKLAETGLRQCLDKIERLFPAAP